MYAALAPEWLVLFREVVVLDALLCALVWEIVANPVEVLAQALLVTAHAKVCRGPGLDVRHRPLRVGRRYGLLAAPQARF